MRTDHKRRSALNPNLDHSLIRRKDFRRGKYHAAGLYPSIRELKCSGVLSSLAPPGFR